MKKVWKKILCLSVENWTNPKEKPKKTLSPIADFSAKRIIVINKEKVNNKQTLNKWNQPALYYNDIISAEMEMKNLWKKIFEISLRKSTKHFAA